MCLDEQTKHVIVSCVHRLTSDYQYTSNHLIVTMFALFETTSALPMGLLLDSHRTN